MMTDPIADLLTRIRNAMRTDAPSVDLPYSRIKEDICKVLVDEGYVVQFEKIDQKPQAVLRIQIKYGPYGERLASSIRRVSKPGRRLYKSASELRPILGGLGIAVLSTSRGVMSDRQARAQKVGGEVICEIY
jgi:small subunit ribosomal protein S8